MKSIMKIIIIACMLMLFNSPVSAMEEPFFSLDAPEKVSSGSSFTVRVVLNNATAIEGIDITITFDPALLTVIDADASVDGVQITAGNFFSGLQAINQADNESGTIRFVTAQGDPGVSGTGAIALINFQALESGTANVTAASAGLIDRDLKRINPAASSVGLEITGMDECFIATAAYGSKYTAPVTLLRRFRDQYLMGNRAGRMVVNFYYRNSPPLADYIGQNASLRAGARIVLAPVVGMAYLCMHPRWIGALLVIGGFIYMLKRWLKNRRRLTC